jgi:hypothetical protein
VTVALRRAEVFADLLLAAAHRPVVIRPEERAQHRREVPNQRVVHGRAPVECRHRPVSRLLQRPFARTVEVLREAREDPPRPLSLEPRRPSREGRSRSTSARTRARRRSRRRRARSKPVRPSGRRSGKREASRDIRTRRAEISFSYNLQSTGLEPLRCHRELVRRKWARSRMGRRVDRQSGRQACGV